jgi:predicted dehydrogenase
VDYASSHYPNDHGNHRRIFLLDFAIHVIDLVRFLFGEVDEVFSYTKDEHSFAVSLRFSCGAVGSLNLTDGRAWKVPTEEVELTLRGGNFMSIHNSSTWRIARDGTPCEWREPPTFVSAGDSGRETGHLAEIEDFLSAIAEGRPTRSTIYESYGTMVLYEAILESARSGKPVAASKVEL